MNPGALIFQRRRDVDHYMEMANVIRSNAALLLTPFKTAKNPATLLKTMRSENFLSDFLNRADKFCSRCCSQAAKIVKERSVLSEIREMPTAELAEEIRDDVFDSLDRPMSGMRGLKDELDNVSAMINGGRIADPAKREQGIKMVRESHALIIKSIGEYLGEITDVIEEFLDYCCEKIFGDQVSFERQQSALQSVQTDFKQKFDPVIKLIQAMPEAGDEGDHSRVGDSRNDLAPAKLRIEFFKGLGVIALILIVLGFILSLLVQ